jgi:hypothetical protein
VPSPSAAPPKHLYNGTKYEDRHAAETAREKDRVSGTLPHDASISVDMGAAEDVSKTSAGKEAEELDAMSGGRDPSGEAGASYLGHRVTAIATPSPSPKKSAAEIAEETKAKRLAVKAQTNKP